MDLSLPLWIAVQIVLIKIRVDKYLKYKRKQQCKIIRTCTVPFQNGLNLSALQKRIHNVHKSLNSRNNPLVSTIIPHTPNYLSVHNFLKPIYLLATPLYYSTNLHYKAITHIYILTAVPTAHISLVVMFPLVILMPTGELYCTSTWQTKSGCMYVYTFIHWFLAATAAAVKRSSHLMGT